MILGDIVERNAVLFPNREAIVFEGSRFTFAEFAERARRVANAGYERGLRGQDRIAVLAQNCSQYLEIYAAGEIAGYITVGVNYRLAVPELAYILADCEPAAVVFEAQYAEAVDRLRPGLPTGCRLLCIGPQTPGWAEDYEAAVTAASPAPPAQRARPDDTAYLIYTSGTTGRPKGVMLGHRGQIETAREKSAAGGVQIDSRILLTMPLYHIGAKSAQLGYSWGGAAIVIHRSFDPAALLRTVERERVTALHLAPVMLQGVLDAPDFGRHDCSSLRTIHYSAAPIPTPLLRRATQAFGPILMQAYGPTETGPLGTVLQKSQHVLEGPPEVVRRLASAGQAGPGCDVRIVRADGTPCATGEAGEVVVRAPSVMQGYWNKTAATLEVLRDGWLYTGDIGYLDDECFLFLVDRKKDMIISGGENIYSREVEEALHAHPAVSEAAVIGVPDQHWGEAVKAVVMLRPGARASEAELIEHCRSRIASYKKPKSIDLIDALPRLPSGKVDKKALRAPYWQGHDRRV